MVKHSSEQRQVVAVYSLICALFFTVLFFRPYTEIFFGDPGLGWHLENGNRLIAGGSLTAIEPFVVEGYATADWIYGQWLADILFSSLVNLSGFSLLYWFCLLLCILPFLLLGGNLRCSSISVLLLLPPILLAASIQWLSRPVLFSFLIFSVLLVLMRTAPQMQFWRVAVSIVLLFVLWANLHPAFVLGFLALGIGVATSFFRFDYQRALFGIVTLTLAILVSLINPNGFLLHREIYALGSSSYFQNLHREWLPPTFSEPAFYPFFLLSGLLLALVIAEWRRLLEWEVVLALVLAGLSFTARRYIPFFCLASVAPLLTGYSSLLSRSVLQSSLVALQSLKFSSFIRVSGVLALLFLLLECLLPSREVHFREGAVFANYPMELLEQLATKQKSSSEPIRLLHGPELGGILSYALWPPRVAIIDDRNEIFAESWYVEIDSFFQGLGEFQSTLAKVLPDYILLTRASPIFGKLLAAGWVENGAEQTPTGEYVLLHRIK